MLGITAEAAESDASKTAKVGGAIRYQTQEVRKVRKRHVVGFFLSDKTSDQVYFLFPHHPLCLDHLEKT